MSQIDKHLKLIKYTGPIDLTMLQIRHIIGTEGPLHRRQI